MRDRSDDFDAGRRGSGLLGERSAGEQGHPALPPTEHSAPPLLHLVLVVIVQVQQELPLLVPLGQGEEDHGEEDDEEQEGGHLKRLYKPKYESSSYSEQEGDGESGS